MWSVVVDIHPSIIADYNFRGFLATPDYGIRGGIPNYVIRGMTRFGLTYLSSKIPHRKITYYGPTTNQRVNQLLGRVCVPPILIAYYSIDDAYNNTKLVGSLITKR